MKSLKSLNVMGLLALTLVVGCTPTNKDNSVLTLNSDASIIGGTPVKKVDGTPGAANDAIATSTVSLIAQIYDENDKPVGQFGCTGSLLGPDIVLTAAHCIPVLKDEKLKAMMFVIFTNDMNTISQKDIRVVTGALRHPDYALDDEEEEQAEAEDARVNKDAEVLKYSNLSSQAQEAAPQAPVNGYDFAVIRFQGPLPAGYKAAKILSNEELIVSGSKVTLAGFGLTDGVKKTNDNKLNKVQVEAAEHYGNEVILDQTQGKGACHGDSGGPAFLEVNGEQLLWGVTSRGIGKDGKDDCSLLSVYGKVFSQRDFINKAIKFLYGVK